MVYIIIHTLAHLGCNAAIKSDIIKTKHNQTKPN